LDELKHFLGNQKAKKMYTSGVETKADSALKSAIFEQPFSSAPMHSDKHHSLEIPNEQVFQLLAVR
jgi:hypothetical protein